MRVAIIHNAMDRLGGAERVALQMARGLSAPIFTTNVDVEALRPFGYELPEIKSVGRVPSEPPWRQEAMRAIFGALRIDGFDAYLITGDWATGFSARNRPCVWYAHSPIRSLWDLRDRTREQLHHPFKRTLFDVWSSYGRWWNRRTIKRVDRIIANSTTTHDRIRGYLGHESTIIHPPVHLLAGDHVRDSKGRTTKRFWLSVNRPVRHKRIELQLDAFAQLPEEQLIIVCTGGSERERSYERSLRARAPSNVTFERGLGQEDLVKRYADAAGLLATAEDEDFGLTLIEAFAHGTPAVAVREGGYLDSMIDGETGILCEPEPGSIAEAVKRVNLEPKRYRVACLTRAASFSEERFIKQLKTVLHDVLRSHGSEIQPSDEHKHS